MYSAIVGLDKTPLYVAVPCHNIQFRLLSVVPSSVVFPVLPYLQWDKIVSISDFHLSLLFLRLNHAQSTPWWSSEDEKFKIHSSLNLFIHPKINVPRCWVVRGQYTVATVWLIIVGYYMSMVTKQDAFKMDVFHIARGCIITNILVSKR